MPPQISLAMELALNEAIDSGESVISIAKKYGVNPGSLRVAKHRELHKKQNSEPSVKKARFFGLKPTEEREFHKLITEEFQMNGRLSLDKVREIGHSVATPGLPFPSLKWVGNHVLKNAAISGFVNTRKTSQVKVLEKEVSVVELEDIDKMKSTILSMIEGRVVQII